MALKNQENGSNAWDLAMQVGDLLKVPGSCLLPGPALDAVTNRQMENVHLSLSVTQPFKKK